VGNITIGGSGKSPFTSYLAEKLAESGRRPVVLLRGYRGSEQGPYIVKGTEAVEAVGDEALMHAQRLRGKGQVVVCRKRVKGAKYIEQCKLGDIILLDDGFQHRYLQRSLDIVLLSPSSAEVVESIEKNLVLPGGMLREDRVQAFRRAGCFVQLCPPVPAAEFSPGFLSAIKNSKPLFHCAVRPQYFVELATGREFPLDLLRGKKAAVLSAIAFPERFIATLRSLDIDIAAQRLLPDHSQIPAALCEGLGREFKYVIVTAKDAVKIRSSVTATANVYALEIGCAFLSGEDEQSFWKLLV
jgi:tetraacyldisaccharide 4'-kinase